MPNIGAEHDNEEYLWVKNEYNCQYKVLVGGFDNDGKIMPELGNFNIISCMNVLEYLPNPKQCIDNMFKTATDRVLINLDINPNGRTKQIYDLPPMKWLCGLQDLLSWIPWPCVYWIYDIKEITHSKYQLFLVATNPDSKLEKIDDSSIIFDVN